MLKVIVLQNFATVGTPERERTKDSEKNWSAVALSENLIDHNRLNGLQHLNTRRLDLVIHNETRFALLNLQTLKIFDCPVANDTIRECISHYLTPNGKLMFGVQPSGDFIVLTEGLQKTKFIRKPAFIKLQQKAASRWYDSIPLLPSLIRVLTGTANSKTRSNRVSPDYDPESPPLNPWWPSSTHVSESLRTKFPYLTSLADGLAVFCAFSPVNCYLFLSSYETALRDKSIANVKGQQIPGRWFRIIMHKSFIQKWLEDKRIVPWFEAKLCYTIDDDKQPTVGGAMVYAVMEGVRLEIVYGIIKRRGEKFTLSWGMVQYDVDWALREPGLAYNLGSKFVVRFSSDCKKLAIVIATHLGIYSHIQEVPFYPESPIKLDRQRCAFCNHSDFDGNHFYKSECWVSDIQWLVEDVYLACMTLCGSLAIFYASGEPMCIKVRKPGAEPDEDKSTRFFYPVFHPEQLQSQSTPSSTQKRKGSVKQLEHPKIKWADTDKILSCSSGTKLQLFSIERVLHVKITDELRLTMVKSLTPTPKESTTVVEEVKEEESVTLLMEPVKPVEDFENKNYVKNNNNNNSSATDDDARYISRSESDIERDANGVYHHCEQET